MSQEQLLQVLTYNIHKGFSLGKLRYILPQMREAIVSVNADLVFLQEVRGEHRRSEKRLKSSESELDYLSHQIWPHVAYGKNAIYQAGHHGNAILSKFPIIEWENINVSDSKRASRSLLHGIIEMPESATKIHIICIHLDLFPAKREEQFIKLCQRIDENVPHNEPLIIAGDFNDWGEEAARHLETDLALKEVFKSLHHDHAKTFPAVKPTLKIDRIYYRGLELIQGECLQTRSWKSLSDHLPLFAEFKVSSSNSR